MFHTHAYLDLRVWHFPPWIRDLALKHIKGEYATTFTPTQAPYKPFRSRVKKKAT
jgi:hypothetical protein